MSGCPSSSVCMWTAMPHLCHRPSQMHSRSLRAQPSAGGFGIGFSLRTAATISRRLVHCLGGGELLHGHPASCRGVTPGPRIEEIFVYRSVSPCLKYLAAGCPRVAGGVVFAPGPPARCVPRSWHSSDTLSSRLAMRIYAGGSFISRRLPQQVLHVSRPPWVMYGDIWPNGVKEWDNHT